MYDLTIISDMCVHSEYNMRLKIAGMLMRPGKSEAKAEARCYEAEAKRKQ